MLVFSNLHSYQQKLIKRAKTIQNVGLLMECGLGKTPTTLTILKNSRKGKTLIIAPKQVAKTVWAQECEKWEHLKDLKVVKILGSQKERLEALKNKDADLYVINIDNVAWLIDNWVENLFDYLVVDESMYFKDPSTKRWKALKKVLKTFKRRFILTGTPTPNGIGDLWSQVGILDLGERLGTSLTKFRDTYMFPAERNRHTHVVYKWAVRPGMEQVIIDKISDICFSLKAEDYLQLPSLTKLYHEIHLDDEVMKKYKQLKKEMVSEIDGKTITAVTAAALANKLLQFTSGTIYTEDNRAEAHSEKIDFLESIIEENQGPTLVFYHYKTALEKLRQAFPDAQELNSENIEDWRQGKIKMLLTHPQSGGVGVNLQCNAGNLANIVWYDLPWSSKDYVQGNARIYRQNQTKPVMLHHLVAHKTIDEQVIAVLDGKINSQDAVMEALKA